MEVPQAIFVNSMSDCFTRTCHRYIKQVFDVMGRAHWHQFQVLTKRAQRLEYSTGNFCGRRTSGWASVSKTTL